MATRKLQTSQINRPRNIFNIVGLYSSAFQQANHDTPIPNREVCTLAWRYSTTLLTSNLPTSLHRSIDATPWRRENPACPKRPADIEVIRVRTREWPCNGPLRAPAPLHTTLGRQAR